MSRKIVCDMCDGFIDLHDNELGVSGVCMNEAGTVDADFMPPGEFHWCSPCALRVVKAMHAFLAKNKS